MATARQALEKLLDSLGGSSQFVTSGLLDPVLPGLEVKGVGTIGFPVSAADAKRLIAKADQAPYGLGEATIVDTDVRRVWQFEPSQFALRNAEWDAFMTAILFVVKREFGISQQVSPELYKLLIYEKGSFFAPHRDTEKTPGMFATLVVCLPSRHEGGTLIVKHDGQTKEIDFGGKNAEFKIHFAAFYADCQHEIEPVTAGYRICLVYNLALAGKKKQPSAPQHSSAVEKTAALLKELFADRSINLTKLAIPFDHQYTEAGLDPQALKGSDRARADVLVRATESLKFQCFFALLTHHQSGSADPETWDYNPYGRRNSRRWKNRYEEDEEDEDEDHSSVEIDEVYDEEIALDHWRDAQGKKQPFKKMRLEEYEILSPEGTKGWAFKQEVNEASGNEGVSVDRWYRRGVLVTWPTDRFFAILAADGQASAIPELERRATRSKKPAALEVCRSFAEEIIQHWKPRQRVDDDADDTSYSARMLKVLKRCGTTELAQRFIRDVLAQDFNGTEGKPLLQMCQHFGWVYFGSALRDFLARQTQADHHRHTYLTPTLSICQDLCCSAPALTEVRRAVCVSLADPIWNIIESGDAGKSDARHYQSAVRSGMVASIFRIFGAISAAHLDRFLDHLLARPKLYDLHGVLIPDVKAIYKWIEKVPAAQQTTIRLLVHCLTELREATAKRIEPPKDWAREATPGCNCEDCAALIRFLSDPILEVGRFQMGESRRQHLQEQMNRNSNDVTHVTERKGSPLTLVCTKTQGSYERKLKQYYTDKSLLAELEVLASKEQPKAVKRSLSK